MDVTSSFPYSVHDVPTEDWTIEQVLQYIILSNTYKINEKRDDMIQSLLNQLEIGKKDIMKLHEQVVDLNQQQDSTTDTTTHRNVSISSSSNDERMESKSITTKSVSSSSSSPEEVEVVVMEEEENTNPNIKDTSTSKDKNPISTAPVQPTTIHISITTGPYQGTNHTLEPKLRRPCFIGRSNGKKFRERGISLARDLEVSTTHGKFERKAGGILYYTDTGSTNGTMHLGEELEDNVPLELENDMELLVGGSTFKIFLSD